jgi:hypothetical protein
MKVTTSFVRNLRKSLLNPDGTAKEGQEDNGLILLHTHKAIQAKAYDYAITYAKERGWDLESLYQDYRAGLALGSNWNRLEEACRKHDPHFFWTSVDKQPTQNRSFSHSHLVKTERDRPFAR